MRGHRCRGYFPFREAYARVCTLDAQKYATKPIYDRFVKNDKYLSR